MEEQDINIKEKEKVIEKKKKVSQERNKKNIKTDNILLVF